MVRRRFEVRFSQQYSTSVALVPSLIYIVICASFHLSAGSSVAGRPKSQPQLNVLIPIPNGNASIYSCPGSDLATGDSVSLPTLIRKGRINDFQYIEISYLIHQLDRFEDFCCSDTISEITLRESKDFESDLKGESYKFFALVAILRTYSFLMEGAVLSVGHNKTTATYYSKHEYCIDSFRDQEIRVKVCLNRLNGRRATLVKCCPLGMIAQPKGRHMCVHNSDSIVMDPGFLDSQELQHVSLKEADPVVKLEKLNCEKVELWENNNCSIKAHPLLDGRLAFIGVHREYEYLKASVPYCVDMIRKPHLGMRLLVLVCQQKSSDSIKENSSFSFVHMISLYIGALSHFLTSSVYVISWSGQNIHGKTVCSCTISLFLMELFSATQLMYGLLRERGESYDLCRVNAVGAQYCMIAAFTWLLILNFDLWHKFVFRQTVRGRKGTWRFFLYCVIGWGVPLFCTGVSIAMEMLFPCRESKVPVPQYGRVRCLVVAPWSQKYFIYAIITPLIGMSCVFAGLTLVKIYTSQFASDNVNSRSTVSTANRNCLLIKLTLVMGVSWSSEVVKLAVTKINESVWMFFDLYNALSGIFIFIIFVWKKSTLDLMRNVAPKCCGK